MKNLNNVFVEANKIMTSDSVKAALKAGQAEFNSFSAVIRNMQTKAIFDALRPALIMVGVKEVADLNVKKLMNETFAEALFIERTKKDGTAERNFGLLREVVKKREVAVYDEKGEKVLDEDGKQVTVRVPVLKDGKPVVEVKHVAVKSWNAQKVIAALAQSIKYREEPDVTEQASEQK